MADLGYVKLEKNDEYINLEDEFDFEFVEGKTYHIQIQVQVCFRKVQHNLRLVEHIGIF